MITSAHNKHLQPGAPARFLHRVGKEKIGENFFELPTLLLSLPTLDLAIWVGNAPSDATRNEIQ